MLSLCILTIIAIEIFSFFLPDPCGDRPRGTRGAVQSGTSTLFREVVRLKLASLSTFLTVSSSLCQVLLPMPGNTVRYPENAMGAWFQERLARDGLGECPFRVSSLKLNLPGCYRPLLALPRNLCYRLQRAACGEGGGEVRGGGSSRTSDGQLNGTAVGGKQDSLALALNFDLDSSCYATVCLREIMKCDP